MLEKLANVFRVPDLRKRILFTLGLLAVYRFGGHIPTPGINADLLSQFFDQNRGSFLGFVDLFSGGQLRRLTIFALGIMPYITASIILQLMTVVYEPLGQAAEGRRAGAQEDHPVDALSHPAVERGAVAGHRDHAGTPDGQRRHGLRQQPRHRLRADDHVDAHHRQRLHHVAGRTDHRARCRQRHVSADFCRYRSRPAARRHGFVRKGAIPGLGPLHRSCHAAVGCDDDRGGRLYRVRRTQRASHPGAVRQAGGRPQDHGRPVNPPSVASELRWRYAGHLCIVGA